MKNDLVVPYLITRFCLVGEEDKSILSPEFQSTLKRAYIHTYTNRLIDPVNKRPEEDKENNNNTITQDTLEPPTKRIKKECYNCKTTKTPCELLFFGNRSSSTQTSQTGADRHLPPTWTAATRVDCTR